MRILTIWDADYPWDVRLEKVLKTVVAAGHEVHLAARNRSWHPPRELDKGVAIRRLEPWRRLGQRLDGITQFPAFMNPRWMGHLGRVATESRPDLLLVRDLPLAPTAVQLGAKRKIPVILDMAENYPAMLQSIWDHGRQAPLDFMVRNPGIARRVESWVLKRVDHILVVVEESRDRLIRLGIDPARITIVSNTPLVERIPETVVRSPREGEPLRMVYLGLLESPRGVDVVLSAVHELKATGTTVVVDIIGTGREHRHFLERAEALGLHDSEVKFHGYVPYDDALAIVQSADIGLVPHIADEAWNTTIPNKLFDYMSMGLPVITSDARPAARIVLEAEGGLVYRSDDPKDLARVIRKFGEPSLRKAAGQAGRAAVLDRYNWEIDGRRLLGALVRATPKLA